MALWYLLSVEGQLDGPSPLLAVQMFNFFWGENCPLAGKKRKRCSGRSCCLWLYRRAETRRYAKRYKRMVRANVCLRNSVWKGSLAPLAGASQPCSKCSFLTGIPHGWWCELPSLVHGLITGISILRWTDQGALGHLVCFDTRTSHIWTIICSSLREALSWCGSLVMNTSTPLSTATADLFLVCAVQGKSCWCNQDLSDLCFSLSSRVTILVKLSCEAGREVRYLPGEHIGIFPGNQPQLVSGLIARVKDAPPADQTVRLETCMAGKLVLFRQNNRGCLTDFSENSWNFL